MICPNPKCGKEIHHVHVYSECVQYADIDEEGRITNYDPVDEVLETTGIECPECGGSLMEFVKEDCDGGSEQEES